MHIQTLCLGSFASNCYIISNDQREALVIDPGSEADQILEALNAGQLNVVAFLLTHGHIDHVSALADVQRRYPSAAVALHPKDASWAFTEANRMLPWFDTPQAPTHIDRSLAEGQTWTDAGWTYEILETPGHSPGSVSFYFKKEAVLFSGDVLFKDSVGRTDLPGGDGRVLAASLKRLSALPEETLIYPGHGPETTLGDELRSNPFMQ